MNILLDTNILIPLEDTSKPLDKKLSKIMQLCSKEAIHLFIHPSQTEDIKRDKNKKRRDIVLSRIQQYQLIEHPPIPSNNDLTTLQWKQKDDNDRIDNYLLFTLYRNAVSILVSNDEGIHKKAKKANLHERVYRIDQFLSFLEKNEKKTKEISVGVENLFVYDLDVNNPFFNSLRISYPDFNDWYRKCCVEHRKCWCIRNTKGTILALCIYNVEINPTIVDYGQPLVGKTLKLCTLKVSEEFRGRKIGERLLYLAFKYCLENDFSWIYLHTHGSEQQKLIGLCEEYGFTNYGKYKNDDVMLKPMKPCSTDSFSTLEYAIKFYPYYLDDDNIGKFIVPIQPKYHDDLFPDISDISEGLFKNDYTMYSTQSNTIKKAYLCNSNCRKIKTGDIILFYRTHDRKSIQCLGIVEQVFFSDNFNEIVSLVSKRTVFSNNDLQEMAKTGKLIILFRYIQLKKTISRKTLEKAGIRGYIQSIRTITNEQYKELLK